MAKKPPVFHADLKPDSREVLVGEEAVLLVGEPVLGTWEAAMALASEVVDYTQSLKGLMGTIIGGDGGRLKGEALVSSLASNLDAIGLAAKHLVQDIAGKRVPELARLILMTPANVRRLVQAGAIPEVPAPSAAGVTDEAFKALRSAWLAPVGAWVTENMTLRQAVVVLDAFVEVTNVADLLGKSRGLYQRTRAALRPTVPEAKDGAASPA